MDSVASPRQTHSRDVTDQVRTSGGAIFARGCCTEDGRLSWPMMQARMGGGRVGVTINRRATAPWPAHQPRPEDYAVPDRLRGSLAAPLYQALLALADGSGIFPTIDRLADMAGPPFDNPRVVRALALLAGDGLIVQRMIGMHRVLRIVATGQILRTWGMSESEVV